MKQLPYAVAISNPRFEVTQDEPCPDCGSRSVKTITPNGAEYMNVHCLNCDRYLYSKISNITF